MLTQGNISTNSTSTGFLLRAVTLFLPAVRVNVTPYFTEVCIENSADACLLKIM